MTDPIRVGVLACSGYVHTRAVWGPIIEPAEGQRPTAMRLTHAWDVDRAEAEAFAGAYPGVRLVERFGDMVGEVDGVILDDFDSCRHFRHLSRPYLEAGVPVFFNRPFALRLEEARAILDMAARHDTPIMSGSAYEYVPAVAAVRRAVADLSPVSGYVVTAGTSDFATHGVHGLFLAHACFGGAIRRVAYQTQDWRRPPGVVTIEHGDAGSCIYGSVYGTPGGPTRVQVFGRDRFEAAVDEDGLFLPMLQVMARLFGQRRMPESYDDLYAKTNLFLAAFRSHVETAGAPVALDDVGDWTAPPPHPERYEPGFFP